MSTLENILLFTFLSSVGGLSGGVLLILTKNYTYKLSHFLAPFAAGILLGATFFELIPEAIDYHKETETQKIFQWILWGILLFFILEHFIHYFHKHDKVHEHEKEAKATVPLIVVGDTIHNFVDGMVVGASFLIDTSLGIVSSLAIMGHEIPQEIADFGLLLHKGLSKIKTVIINIFSALASLVGALIVYSFGYILEGYISLIIAATAGFFIYIATSDLLPEIHYEKRRYVGVFKSIIMLGGIFTIWIVIRLLE